MRDRRPFSSSQTHIASPAFRQAVSASLALLLVTALSAASAEDASLKHEAKRAGHTLGSVARDVGQGAKKVGKAVGNAAKEGGREFRRAVKGESR